MDNKGNLIVWTITIVAGLVCFIIWWKGHKDKQGFLQRSLLTLVVCGIFLPSLIHPSNLIATLVDAMCLGLAMFFIWGRFLIGYIAGAFGGLYDGGNQEIEARPLYSIFRSQRNRGKYFEALTEIRKQLDKFPTDFEGQNLLAELQAKNLNDLPGAEVTVTRACAQKERTAGEIAYALNQLADWHLEITKDRDSAQKSLEKIIELLPDSEMSLRASQRIAHLADTQMLLAPVDRQRRELKKGIENLGLARSEKTGKLIVPDIDPAKQAAELAAQLEQHPLDTVAREKLAIIYADHYHRLDMAVDQLEQMIAQPSHTKRQLTHWLNLMADLQVKEAAAIQDVQATLQRIVDLDPDVAAAGVAQRRKDNLKLELRAQVKPPQIAMGTYEQNLGLKRKSPE